jgi:ABC-type Mn2+/Zn2+ transport system permease subunit
MPDAATVVEYPLHTLLTALLAGLSCGLLGPLLVLRNMALMGDALSHSVLPGIVLGFVVAGHHPLALFAGAVVAGLLSVMLITWLQRNATARTDASIGSVFSFMFALGVIGIAWLSRGQGGMHLDLENLLFGDVTAAGPQDSALTALMCGATLLFVLLFFRQLQFSSFMPQVARVAGIRTGWVQYALLLLLALVVVSAMQSVGVILVIALLVTPASTALLLARRLQHVLCISSLLGVTAAALGLLLAQRLHLPSGPCITVVAFGVYIITVVCIKVRDTFVYKPHAT